MGTVSNCRASGGAFSKAATAFSGATSGPELLAASVPGAKSASRGRIMSQVPKILVVEDDDAIRALLIAALRREPFDVHAAMHGAQALNMTQATDYAVILLDLMMPTLNGIEFLEAFHQASPQSRSV